MPQTTALALKAIVAYSEARADEFEPGTVSVALVDSQDAGAADQNLGRLEVETHTILPPLQLSGFEDIVAAGRNRFRLRSATSGAIGYRFWVDFQAEEIKSNDECPIVLDLKLDSAECRVGERIGLAASVTNRSETIQPMVTAVIGIPAGLELPPETLDRLKSQKLADSIQSRPRELTLCWRDIGPKQRIDMSIDLIAAIPGRFTGPPSRAFLTHSPDIGTWIAPRAITITRDPFVDGN